MVNGYHQYVILSAEPYQDGSPWGASGQIERPATFLGSGLRRGQLGAWLPSDIAQLQSTGHIAVHGLAQSAVVEGVGRAQRFVTAGEFLD
jgi:hypothetical protein